jgi:ABC-2 type transport system permease protein
MMSLRNVKAMFWKETVRLRRDRSLIGVILIQPVIFLIIYGTIITYQIFNIRWVVEDRDSTELSRRLVGDVMATGRFEHPGWVIGEQARLEAFKRHYAAVVLVIPEGFKRRVMRGEPAYVQLLLNGADPLVALRAGSYVAQVVARLRPSGPPAVSTPDVAKVLGGAYIDVRKRFWFNPDLSDRFYFLSALPSILLTQIVLGLGSVSVAIEREEGTFEQLLSSPIGTIEIIIGKMIPYVILAYAILLGVIGANYFFFGMHFRGSLIAMCVATFPFILVIATIGLLFSTLSRSLFQGVFLGFFFILFSVNLSDYFYPTQTMPTAIRYASYLFPMKYYVALLRGIGVRGATLAEMWSPIAACSVYFLVTLAILARVSRRTIA